MSRIVVTGGAGFLGSHIAATLSARGHDVVIFDRQPSRYLLPSQQQIVGDVTDSASVAHAVQGAEAIFHLAALADLNVAKSRPVASAQINVLGTLNFLEAARQAGVRRFMFASTVYVYSREGGFYRCSKQACESYIEEYERQFGLPYTILRYGSLYGPHADESNGVFRLLLQAATDGRIRHSGSPDDMREYIHVEDAARLSVEALSDEYANHHLVLTGHYPMRVRDLFTMFGEILGRPVDVEYAGEHAGHYHVTPYTYTPRVGRKLTLNHYVDMGQGILQVLEQMAGEGRLDSTAQPIVQNVD